LYRFLSRRQSPSSTVALKRYRLPNATTRTFSSQELQDRPHQFNQRCAFVDTRITFQTWNVISLQHEKTDFHVATANQRIGSRMVCVWFRECFPLQLLACFRYRRMLNFRQAEAPQPTIWDGIMVSDTAMATTLAKTENAKHPTPHPLGNHGNHGSHGSQ